MATLVEAAAQVFSREGMAATTNRIAERGALDRHPQPVLPGQGRTAARICAEVAFHLKRCDRGTIGASEATGNVEEDPELTAHSIVALVDAQLHRVMPHHGYDIEALRLTVARLAPPAPLADPPPPAG